MTVPRPAASRRLLAYVRPYRAAAALAISASAVAAAAAASYAYLLGPLLKGLLTGTDVQLGPLNLSRADLATRLPLLLVGIALAKSAAQLVQGGLMQGVGQKVTSDLRRDLYRHLLALPPRFFETRHSGELVSRLTSDAAQVEFAVTQALSSYVKDTLQVVALLAVCLALDVRLFALSFVVLPVATYPVAKFARSVKRVAKGTQASLGQLSLLAAEQLHNLPVVLAYGGAERAKAQFDQGQGRYLDAMKRSLVLRGAFTPVVEILGMVGASLAVGVGASAVFHQPALASKLLSFLAAALLMYQPLKALSGTFSLVAQGLGASQRLFELADEPAPAEDGTAVQPLRRELCLEGVRVSYDGQRFALSGATLHVPAGRRVALVGASGAGKTTVFSALLRLAPLTSGRIVWDAVDLSAAKASSLRAQIAWVPQDPILFSGTVRQNLVWGRHDASEVELWKALRQAHADAFVREFPRGLDEPVGERGGRLSGGQRQRLAIARAFVRQPSLLLLDEPTSALDAESERGVQAGLAELMKGRTTLIIAHRLSTVKHADLLYVLEEGKVVEEGNHEALLARGGRYAGLLSQGEVEA